MQKKITQAFILGAGLGTRLRPITETIPKVMVPIAPGKPLLEHIIELLREQGITDFIVNVHYFPEAIRSHFGDGSRFGVRIRYSDESDRLMETGGALKKAERMLDDDFLFLYGDELHFLNIEPLIDLHFSRHPLGTIALKTSDAPQAGEVAEFDPETKRILKWHTRPHNIREYSENLLVNAGIYILSKRIISYIPEGVPIKLDGDIIPEALAARETVFAFPTEEAILDIGTPEKYAKAKEYYNKKKNAAYRK